MTSSTSFIYYLVMNEDVEGIYNSKNGRVRLYIDEKSAIKSIEKGKSPKKRVIVKVSLMLLNLPALKQEKAKKNKFREVWIKEGNGHEKN